MIRRLALLLFLLLPFTGCVTKADVAQFAARNLDPAERQDLLSRLAASPLWVSIIRHAKTTLANVDAWKAAGQISSVNEANARMCPNALLGAVPDLQAKILALRDVLGAVGKVVDDDDPSLLVTLTTLEYGPRSGALSLEGMRDDIRARFRLVDNSCRGLGIKALVTILGHAAKLGLKVQTGGLGG